MRNNRPSEPFPPPAAGLVTLPNHERTQKASGDEARPDSIPLPGKAAEVSRVAVDGSARESTRVVSESNGCGRRGSAPDSVTVSAPQPWRYAEWRKLGAGWGSR